MSRAKSVFHAATASRRKLRSVTRTTGAMLRALLLSREPPSFEEDTALRLEVVAWKIARRASIIRPGRRARR